MLVPFEEKEGGMLRGYRIGTYLAERVRGKTPPPEGFLEITPADVDIQITAHLKVEDFLNHDQRGVWPSYAAVNPKLLDKLELVIAISRGGMEPMTVPTSSRCTSGYGTRTASQDPERGARQPAPYATRGRASTPTEWKTHRDGS